MSIFSTNRLPAQLLPGLLALKDIVISHDLTANNQAYVIHFGVTAVGMAGRQATVTLRSLPLPFIPIISKSLTLTTGVAIDTLRLPMGGYNSSQSYFITVTVGTLEATSDYFTLNPTIPAPCDCGQSLEPLFKTLPASGGGYGPVYYGNKNQLAQLYPRWQELISAGDATADERDIISTMSKNEGAFDAVQSYDSEILSVGAMQKTIKDDLGGGELSEQLYIFSQEFPVRFDCLLGTCGWAVSSARRGRYHVTYTEGGTVYEGSTLKQKIRLAHSRSDFKDLKGKEVDKKKKNPVVDSFIQLGKDNKFQDRQIKDFISRLRDEALTAIPVNEARIAYDYTIGDYFQSNIGRALVLDESVKKRSHPPYYVGAALEELFRVHSSTDHNPGNWGPEANGAPNIHEQRLIIIYGRLRYTKSFTKAGTRENMSPMNDGATRQNKIKKAFASLPGYNVNWLPDAK